MVIRHGFSSQTAGKVEPGHPRLHTYIAHFRDGSGPFSVHGLGFGFGVFKFYSGWVSN